MGGISNRIHQVQLEWNCAKGVARTIPVVAFDSAAGALTIGSLCGHCEDAFEQAKGDNNHGEGVELHCESGKRYLSLYKLDFMLGRGWCLKARKE